ncbi:MAG: DcaP family trimeric outer membrane transporter [Alphaproteobacteria bacterium]|nr:DcaP family trimeric outer membrane transporter [Alphaproteobacteria bacterium]
MKKHHAILALLCGVALIPTQAFAISDTEFEALKAQMTQMAERLQTIESEQTSIKHENEQLKQKNQALTLSNKALEQKVSAIESQPKVTISSSEQAKGGIDVASIEPAAGDATARRETKPGEFLVPGTDTTLKLGGYVKADVIHDFNVTRSGLGEEFTLFSQIPLKNSNEDRAGGNTRMHAKQTRLNLTATTPTEYGDLKIFVEGDFFQSQGNQTTTNAEGFGLRHAYGELGSFIVGQTWSNYMDLDAYPETLDYVGPTGITLLRQGQIRYTHRPDGSKNSYSIALENPQSDFAKNPGNPGSDTNINQFPDVTANAKFVGDAGELSVKGVLRQLGAYNTTNANKDRDTGYAVAVSGKLKVGEKDDLRFQLGYGDGIGRYIYDVGVGSGTGGQGGAFTSTATHDDFEAIKAWGGYAAYRHMWSDKWRSNLLVGTTQITDNPSYLNPATTNERIYSGEANLIWAVTPKVDIGGAYIYGKRETESGADGTLHRAQMSAIYKF